MKFLFVVVIGIGVLGVGAIFYYTTGISDNRRSLNFLCGAGYVKKGKDLTNACKCERLNAEKHLQTDFSRL